MSWNTGYSRSNPFGGSHYRYRDPRSSNYSNSRSRISNLGGRDRTDSWSAVRLSGNRNFKKRDKQPEMSHASPVSGNQRRFDPRNSNLTENRENRENRNKAWFGAGNENRQAYGDLGYGYEGRTSENGAGRSNLGALRDSENYENRGDSRPVGNRSRPQDDDPVSDNDSFMNDKGVGGSGHQLVSLELDGIDVPVDQAEEVGLMNIGNSCYINSCIQALRHIDKFTNIISTENIEGALRKLKSRYKDKNFSNENLKITIWLNKCLNNLNKGESDRAVDCIRHIKENLTDGFFNNFEQHDAQEFLNFLVEEVRSEMDLNQGQPVFVRQNTITSSNNLEEEYEKWLKNEEKRENSPVSSCFEGVLLETLECANCGRKTYRFRKFFQLDLDIRDHVQFSSIIPRIDEYVEDFFKAEVIGGFTCDACKHTGDVTKEIRIWKFPDILLVSFKRFLWGVDSCQKIKGEVCIPDDKVDLKAYAHLLTYDASKGGQYQLISCINHRGELNSGHYIAECYSKSKKAWYEFNDSNVRRITEGRQVNYGSQYIYLCVFERAEKPNLPNSSTLATYTIPENDYEGPVNPVARSSITFNPKHTRKSRESYRSQYESILDRPDNFDRMTMAGTPYSVPDNRMGLLSDVETSKMTRNGYRGERSSRASNYSKGDDSSLFFDNDEYRRRLRDQMEERERRHTEKYGILDNFVRDDLRRQNPIGPVMGSMIRRERATHSGAFGSGVRPLNERTIYNNGNLRRKKREGERQTRSDLEVVGRGFTRGFGGRRY